MNAKPHGKTVVLERLGTLPLCASVGAKIACVSGELWVTQENDARDIILGPGQEFTIDRPGLTLVHAAQPSVVHMENAGNNPVRDCVEASAKRMRAAMFAYVWRWLRSRVPGLAS